MAHEAAAKQEARHFAGLPLLAVGPVEVGRLLRELEALDNFMEQAALRTPGTALQLPKLSKMLDQTAELNKINLLQENERARLKEFLQMVKEQAPILHMSFSTDPSAAFIEKLMVWLRREIHPIVLLTIGLEPNIGAGCILRTTNQYFDFSLRERFMGQRGLLMKELRGSAAHG